MRKHDPNSCRCWFTDFGSPYPGLAVGLECIDYPSLDSCPLYGGNTTARASAYELSRPQGMLRTTMAIATAISEHS